MSFRNRMMLVITVACIVCSTAAIFVSSSRTHILGAEALVSKSKAILSRLEAVRGYVALQGGLDEQVAKAVKQFPNGDLSEDAKKDILRQVPIFASMTVGNEEAAKEHYAFRVFATEPRRKENKATEFETEIFNKFANDEKLTEWVDETSDKITVYRPVRLSQAQGCLTCHGEPNTSPWKNGKDILGYDMENWKDGRLHGVFAISADTSDVKAAATTATWHIAFWSFLVTIGALSMGFFMMRGSLNQLTAVIFNLKEAGQQVNAAATEISTSSQALSAATSEAAASLEETTASTEEMSAMINLNANNAESARDLSQTCEKNARHGKTEVDRLIIAMNDISESSKKIEEIISVIDDIAFQTNLLALNAAVEAARAGEQGKGFSVVAEAVRSLAQRSATSAKEISGLIKESVEKIQQGGAIAKASGQSLTEIVTSVEKVAQLNSEISTASREQSQGVTNINKAINELDRVTQQNAAGSEETAAASEELSAQASQLHVLVTELNSVLEGKTEPGKKEKAPKVPPNAKYESALPMAAASPAMPVEQKNKTKKISSIEAFNRAS